MRRYGLSILVFVAGACSLATEMAGARLLAPYFGTSNLVWANVIGLILLYLSLGYWVGGKFADRYPTPRALGVVILGAAATIAALPFLSRPLFRVAVDAFGDLSAGAFVASFLGTMLLFAVPITALGAVSPWAIRLAVRDVSEAGTVAGRLYALSTIGSIAGTFVPVLVLIPSIGTQRTILLSAALLALSSLLVLPRRAGGAPALIAALIALPGNPGKGTADGTVLYERESAYQFVQVIKRTSGDVVLHLNEGWAVHSILPAKGTLTGGYWDAFLTMPVLADAPHGRVAVLGNAGGTVSNLFREAWPTVHVDGVEIDPLVSKVGRRFFGMGGPNLTVHNADARFWLQGTNTRFDSIIVDAYRQPYVPFHLVSREFFGLVRDRLNEHGVVAINVGTPPGHTEAVNMIAQTMRRVFPVVQESRYDEFNSVVIAYRNANDARAARPRLAKADGMVRAPAQLLAASLADVTGTDKALTDDYSPIERLTDRALLSYLREGAPGA